MRGRKLKSLFLFGASLGLVTLFQNCGDFGLKDQVLYEQGLIDSRTSLDAEALPRLLNSKTLSYWYKKSNSTFVNSPGTLGDQFSIIAVAKTTSTGTIISVNSGAGIEEGSISIISGKIRFARTYTTSSEYIDVAIPSGDWMVLAASFGSTKSKTSFLVNGLVQNGARTTVGTPLDFSYVAKLVSIPVVASVNEYMVFVGDSQNSEGYLSAGELNSLSRYLANNNQVPNVIFDPYLANPNSGDTGGTNDGGTDVNTKFLAAKAIFEAKCTTCHRTGSYSPDLVNLTESKALANGWVVAKNPGGSKLYSRLQGSGGANANMPQGGSISAAEVLTVSDWINSLK